MTELNINQLKTLMNKYFDSLEKIKPLPKLIDGNEIMQLLNIKPSALLGKIILELKNAQEEGEITTKEEAICFIKERF